VESTLKTYKTLYRRITDNYYTLWSKYQNKKKVLAKCKRFQERLNKKIHELNKNIETVECQLRKQEDRNKCLEDNNNRLEASLMEEKNNVACLKSQYQNQKQCLEKTVDELTDTTQILKKTNEELDNNIEENCKLTSALEILNDKFTRTLDKHNIEKLQTIKNNNIINTELEIQKYRNTELNKSVCEQKCKLQEQAELLEKSNDQNEKLKEMIANERVQVNESIEKLRKEKLIIECEMEQVKNQSNEYVTLLECLELENNQLKTQINEFKFKLDTVIKNSDEKLKSLTEKLKNVQANRKQLKGEITSTNQINAELKEQLLVAKKMHKAEIENVHNLEKKLKNACQKSTKYSQNSNTNPCNTGPFLQSYMKVLDELKSTGEYSCLNSEDSLMENVENNNMNFEKLISKCESIINVFNK